MLIEIEQELIRLQPDLVLVYGDTNSTLAGALAASKLHIPLAHVEAGLRSYFRRMPEEQNRVLTDHLADWLFCPTETAVKNLDREGISDHVHHVGDIMLDASFFYREQLKREQENSVAGQDNGGSRMNDGGAGRNDAGAGRNKGVSRLGNIEGLTKDLMSRKFLLATVHRAENTDDPQKLGSIAAALNEVSLPVVLPLHPRTKKLMAAAGITFSDNVTVTGPVGYLEMLELEMKCAAIITDSGGVQKEAYFLEKPCVTLREQTEWVETEKSGWNSIVGTDRALIVRAVENLSRPDAHPDFYGTGDAGNAMLEILSKKKLP